MKKSDLKNGMVVELECGTKRFLINGKFYEKDFKYSHPLDNYNEDLTTNIKELNIKKVYQDISAMEDYCNAEAIWVRTGFDWAKVPFGTKVICWDRGDKEPYYGVFLEYAPNSTYPFQVYVPKEDFSWENCKVAEDVHEITPKQLETDFRGMCHNHPDCKGCDYEGITNMDFCRWKFLLDNFNVLRKVGE